MKGLIGLRIEDWVGYIGVLITGAFIGAYLVEEHYRKKRDRDGH